jgi:predicted dehydrogenase
MSHLDRREFLRHAASASSLLTLAARMGSATPQEKPVVSGRPGDVNSQIRVAVVGVRGQGGSHVNQLAGNTKNNTIVTHICDVDSAVIGKAMKLVEERQGKAPVYEKDIRKLLECKEIDCISIATPNHWHALATIWAIQAGKDVYVEKPVSHNVHEGRVMVEFARKYGRIVQTGTQSRSQQGMRQAIEFVRSGKIGKVHLARGLCYKLRPSIGKTTGEQSPPKTMDYDLWCGPAPYKLPRRRTLDAGTVHYHWHWFWDYGNGDLGNQGIHEMDKARWGLGQSGLPRAVQSLGGRLGYDDDGETANTQICVFDYGDSQLIFEVRGLPTPPLQGAKVGNIFYGSEGYVVCPSYSSGIAFTKDGEKIAEFKGGGDHFGNFIEAVRTRDPKRLHADILEGHISSALCHLGNISYRLGELKSLEAATEALGPNSDAVDAVKRMIEHLAANQVKISETQIRCGPRLNIDSTSERFLGHEAANAYLFREYRKGFEVPEHA